MLIRLNLSVFQSSRQRFDAAFLINVFEKSSALLLHFFILLVYRHPLG